MMRSLSNRSMGIPWGLLYVVPRMLKEKVQELLYYSVFSNWYWMAIRKLAL